MLQPRPDTSQYDPFPGSNSNCPQLRSVIVQRLLGALLVADRTDIAASAECDGVVLSDDGVPVVVARKSLTSASGVVACGVKDEQAALIAAKEGADLILAPNGRVADAVRGKISVPVFASPRNGWVGVGAQAAIFSYMYCPLCWVFE